MKIIVDISDARVSNAPTDELMTYSLGSCIGVTLYDAKTKVGGMLHYQLPSSKLNARKSSENPFMFADTGMEWLVNKMMAMGVAKKQLRVKIAGGAQMLNDAQSFNIGKRNYAAIRQLLWKNGMFIDAEDIGGQKARHLSLNIGEGTVVVKSEGKAKEL